MAIDHSLCLVADADFFKKIAVPAAAGRDLSGLVEAAVRGGVTVVQLRAKNLATRDFVELGLEIAGLLAGTGVPLLVNDRLDVALACGAAGVHLGQEDMPVPLARRILGPAGAIGVSVNTPEEARRAEREGANYIGAGPAYATATKETAPLAVLGPEGIGRIKRAVRIPVVAIGGIGAGNAAAIAGAGADGIAVISAILGAPDARRAAEQLKKAFQR
ncbi:MAG: thiamine-phosphate diphosphorylase [Candidatus Aminicenantes bacterium RBG_16_63_14]|nr:MAG: thiamine-phosphate diphosphorylase [Candidatus Aminicenantes bacterium RBG_16_63_14]